MPRPTLRCRSASALAIGKAILPVTPVIENLLSVEQMALLRWIGLRTISGPLDDCQPLDIGSTADMKYLIS